MSHRRVKVPVPRAESLDTLNDALLQRLQQQLPTFLLTRRWYPAKDSGLPAVELASSRSIGTRAGEAALTTWTVRPVSGPQFQICLPVMEIAGSEAQPGSAAGAIRDVIWSSGDGSRHIIDALESDDFVLALVDLIVASESGPALAAPAPSLAAPAAGDRRISRSRAEQSNTSIRIGEDAILKLFRRVVEGVHPEVEMDRYLTAHLAPDTVPALYGALEMDGCTVAVLQSFVPNDGDGWNWTLERLRRSDFESTYRWIAQLGRRTAEMHLALAAPSEDPAFQPEAATAQDWDGWLSGMLDMQRRIQDNLKREGAGRTAAAGGPSATGHALLDSSREHLQAKFESLLPAEPFLKTRVHGDFHLGQVLVRNQDATIVDFEGEPLRPLAERRAKAIALRDVAGMLRSFDYAAASVRNELPADLGRQWAERAAEGFLLSYLETLQSAGAALESSAAQRVLKLFMIEKALYEVLYEQANRPAWVDIPLQALDSLLSGLA